MYFIYSIIVFIISILSLYHWRNQPLYADDGNWFYDAEFDNEISLYRLDYFGIGFIAKYFRKVYFVKSEKAYYDLKIIWFSLLNSVLFITCYVLFNDYLIAVLSVLFHIIFQVLPQTRYSLTYGENFLLLPVLIGFLLLRAAFISNNLFLYLLAGLFFGWAYQIKIVSILIIVPVIGLFLNNYSLIAFVCIVIGFLCLTFLNGFFVKGLDNKVKLLCYIFKNNLYFYLFSSKLIKLCFFKKLYSFDKKEDNSYVAQMSKVTYLDFYNEFCKSILPTIQNTFFVCVISLCTLFFYIINFNINVFFFTILLIFSILIPIVEKSIPPSHFNHVWLPVSALAAIGLRLVADSNNLFLSILCFILVLISLNRIIMIIINRFKNQNNLSDYPQKYNLKFHYAKVIGTYIQNKSDKNDFLFVWGNCPSIYIYSKRKIVDKNYFFLYLYGKFYLESKITKLFAKIKKYPPKWFLFYKIGIFDEWGIEVIKDITHIPYNLHKVFNLELNSTTYYKESLYEVDVLRFREILFDRFITHYYDSEDCYALYYGLSSYLSKSEIDSLMNIDNDKNIDNYNSIDYLIVVFKYLNTNQIEKAKDVLNYVKKNELPAIFQLLLGEIYFFENNIESALECFLNSIDLNQYLCSSWNNLGVLYKYYNDIDKAKKSFVKALNLNENYYVAQQNLITINNL